MPDAAYYRAWRAAHPEYRKRELERLRKRKAAMTPEQRRRDRGVAKRSSVDDTPLPLIYPQLQHGTAVAFWEDELRLDLAQEACLATLEGRDPDEATCAYRQREVAWRHHTCPFLLDGDEG